MRAGWLRRLCPGGIARSMGRRISRLLVLTALGALAACAGNMGGGPANDLLRSGRYDEAVVTLEAIVAAEPDNARARRNLGVARFHGGNPAGAVADLQEARRLDPADELVLVHLGQAAEAAGRDDTALDAWGALLERRPRDAEVSTHLRDVRLRHLRATVAAALDAERAKAGRSPDDRVVAVLEFRNLTPDSVLAPLSRGLAAMVSADLAQVNRFRVVERDMLPVLLREVELGRSTVRVSTKQGTVEMAAVDSASAPRAGRLLGAGLLVTGGLSGAADRDLRLDAGFTETASGRARGAGADASGPLEQLFRMEKEIVRELLTSVGVELTPEEEERIGTPPTHDMDAFLAWSEGLAWLDADRPDAARASFERALRLDPGFGMARQQLLSLSGTAAGFSRLVSNSFEQLMAGGGDEPLRDRLDAVAAVNGRGLGPGRAGDDRLNPAVAPVGTLGRRGQIVIIGEVPR